MRNPRVRRWKTLPDTSGMLFFAQRLEECLYDYTLDSYKAPALNTHSRCLELKRAIQHVRKHALPEKSLTPMLEELASSIQHDSAASQLLGPHASHFTDASNWKGLKLGELDVYLDQIRNALRGKYAPELIRQLHTLIPEGKRKEEILSLTNNLVVEWINQGWSKDYIYYRTRGFFFSSRGPAIVDCEPLASFFDIFSHKPRNWTVTLRGGKEFTHAVGMISEKYFRFATEQPELASLTEREAAFYEVEHDGIFISVEADKALDANSARIQAERRLEVLVNLMRFHVHRVPFTWSRDALITTEGLSPIVLGPPKQSIHKSLDCPLEEMPNRVSRMLRAFGPRTVSDESWQRLATVLNMHATALTADTVEAQFSSLWTALESLLPLEEAESRIGRIAELTVPLLSRGYPEKLLHNLDADLAACAPTVYSEVLDAIPGSTSVERCASLISVAENESLRDRLYIALEKNPLLKHRIYALKMRTETSAAVLQLIEEHSQRVSWHLHRIYRSRNLLVHSGRTLPFHDALLENLHSYVDQLIFSLQEVFVRTTPPRGLDNGLLTIRLEHQTHTQYLREHRRERCTIESFRTILFGPQSS